VLLIPAIDIKDGRCVRLRQGRFDDVTVFSDDPAAMAVRWLEAGCRRLHLVDLDGAVAGEPRNADAVGAICRRAGSVPVQVGGGIRDLDTIGAYLDAGVNQVIIGTRAVEDPEFLGLACAAHPDRIILGLDARDGRLATDGWEATSGVLAVDVARAAAAHAVHALVYTDIARDGMLSGLNVAATIALAEASRLPVIASGGVKTQADLEALAEAARASGGDILGAITGRALYEGTLDFTAAQASLDARSAPGGR
jgi:phosphoribosylformimino-5-aminoimidazole carboxamide ribotide isomerase